MKISSRTYTLSIERHDDGYLAHFPALRGCHTWGKSYEDAVQNAKEAIELYRETLTTCGDPLPDDQPGKELVSLGITVRTPIIS